MAEQRQPIRATADTFIHYLFATPGNEPVLMSFVNALLAYAEEPLVRETRVLNPFNPKTFLTEKRSVIDIKAVATNDRQFVIEFQTLRYDAFVKRLLFNWAKTYSGQLTEGEHYRLLLPVMVIAVTNYSLFDRLPDLCNLFYIAAKDEPTRALSNDFQLHTLELIEKKIDRIPSLPKPLRNWTEFFWYSDKKTRDEMKTLLEESDPMVQLAYEKYDLFTQDTELRLMEETRQQYLHDRASELEYAERKGREEGIEKGREEGKAEGRAEGEAVGLEKGLEKGIEKGKLEEKLTTARNLKRFGVERETIAKATGLPVEEIDRLD
jgi:predicted transposase/invertase (TIGR01784 family)